MRKVQDKPLNDKDLAFRYKVKDFLEKNYPKSLLDNNLSLLLSALYWLSSTIAKDYNLYHLRLDIFSECYRGLSYALRNKPKLLWDIALRCGDRYCIKEIKSQGIALDRLPLDRQGYETKEFRFQKVVSLLSGIDRAME